MSRPRLLSAAKLDQFLADMRASIGRNAMLEKYGIRRSTYYRLVEIYGKNSDGFRKCNQCKKRQPLSAFKRADRWIRHTCRACILRAGRERWHAARRGRPVGVRSVVMGHTEQTEREAMQQARCCAKIYRALAGTH